MLLATTARVFPPEVSLREQLAALAAAGFDGVELNLEAAYGLDLPLADSAVAEIRAALEHSGLRLASVYSRAQWTTPISHPDPQIREAGRQVLLELIDAAEVLGCDARRNDGLRRTWYWACREESINPRQPSRLPLLFALDTKLGIAGGFHYVPDCNATARHNGSDAHCGSSFSDSSGGSGDAGGLGGSESSGSSGDASSGDGSSGCGGGCGGGGGD